MKHLLFKFDLFPTESADICLFLEGWLEIFFRANNQWIVNHIWYNSF
jgi:hypothetical protein